MSASRSFRRRYDQRTTYRIFGICSQQSSRLSLRGRSGLYLTEVPSDLMQAIVQLIGDRRASCSTPRRWLQTSPSGKPTWRSWEEHLRQRVAMSTNVDLLRRIIIERVFNRGDLSVAGEVCAHGFVSISIYYRRSYPVPRFSRSRSNLREARFVISP